MEGYIIYIIIGVVVFVVAAGGIWYYVSRNQEKQIRQELFEGEGYCIVASKLKEDSNLLGKRKY